LTLQLLPAEHTTFAQRLRAGLVWLPLAAAILAAFLLLASAVLWRQFLGGSLLLVCLVVLLRRGLALLGPVFFYDALRTARRGRHRLLRCLYAGLLLVVLALVYARWFVRDPSAGLMALFEGGRVDRNDLARFAESFFYTFLGAQYAVVLLVTPAYTAGAIAEERQARTLESLLATGLSSTELVLGKLASRVVHLVLLLLTGLPVLSLLQLVGGVDPRLLAIGFANTLGMMLGMSALGILVSVNMHKPRQAMAVSYAAAIAYQLFAVTFCSPAFLSPGDMPDLPPVLVVIVFFHGMLATICVAGAVSLLRRATTSGQAFELAAVTQDSGRVLQSVGPSAPPLGDLAPMVWKERFAQCGVEGSLFSEFVHTIGPIYWLGLVGMSWLSVLFMALGGGLQESVGVASLWAKATAAATICIVLFMMALRAAETISAEREQHTLDSLLTTDLTDGEILGAKWQICWRSGWRYGLGLVIVVVGGIVTGGLCPFAIPLLAVACGVYAAIVAVFGMYCSLVCRSGLRATLTTVVGLLGVFGGHWLLYLPASTLLLQGGHGEAASLLGEWHAFGLTPPLAIIGLCFSFGDFEGPVPTPEAARHIGAALVGIAWYAALSGLLWWRVRRRFARLRMP
jgi:ABC-type transport system involved in multi-copper enzyme maturation permease subunit